MATTSSLGIGAGVDLQGMLTKLIAVEKAPIDVLSSKIDSTTSKISLYGTLNSKLSALQTAGNTLRFPSQLSAITATSSNEATATVSSTFVATRGQYSLEVVSLASAQKSFSQAYVSNTTFASGTMDFQVGEPGSQTAYNIDLTGQASYTLAEVRDAINDKGMGVTASIVSGTDGDRLILTSDKTGADRAFSMTSTLTASNSQPSLADFDATPGLAISTASNALIKIDGIAVSSTSNEISDAVAGLSFTAKAVGTSKITVSTDSSAIVKAAQTFVDSYNAAVTLIKSNSNYDVDTKTAQLFNADFAARSVLTSLSGTRATVPTELAGANLQNLYDVGISIDKYGLLTLDSSKLQQAVASSSEDVTKLLGAYGTAFSDSVTSMQSPGGIVNNRVSSLNTLLVSDKERQTALEYRISLVEQNYRKQFTALDVLISSMQTTSSYLTQQLANL